MITIELVTTVLCREFNVAEIKLTGKDRIPGARKSEYAKVRQYAMYLCRILELGSQTAIGRYFNRHHCTVLYAERTVGNRISVYPRMKKEIERLVDIIRKESRDRQSNEVMAFPDYIMN